MTSRVQHSLKEISPDSVPEADNKLRTAKIDLVREFPFMGYLLMTAEYKFTRQLETMAATTIPTQTIYVNPDFIITALQNRRERAYVLLHEVFHIYLEHIGRQIESSYHAGLWNVAADYMINTTLNDLNTDRITMPDFGLADTRFRKMSADEIYHTLLEENDNDANKAAAAHGGQQVKDQSENGSGGGQGEDGDGDGEDADGGNAGKNGKRPFDALSNENVSEATRAENQQRVSAAMSEHGESFKNMGSGAAHLAHLFEQLIQPVLPWKQIVAEYITDSAKTRSTYNRISRRSTSRIVFPTLTGDHLSLVFGIDTSGSMSHNELVEAMSEVKSITEQFESWSVYLVTCDTGFHLLGEYHSEEGDEWGTVNKELIGGGGTELSPMIDYANELADEADIAPNCCVIVTDGHIPEEPYENAIREDVPVITVVSSRGKDNLDVPSSKVVKMTDHKN